MHEMDAIPERGQTDTRKLKSLRIPVQAAQKALAAQVPKAAQKRIYCHETNDEELREKVRKDTYDKVYAVAKMGLGKQERSEKFSEVIDEFIAENFPEEGMDKDERAQKVALAKLYYHDVERDAVRRLILDEGIRLDGRKTTKEEVGNRMTNLVKEAKA